MPFMYRVAFFHLPTEKVCIQEFDVFDMAKLFADSMLNTGIFFPLLISNDKDIDFLITYPKSDAMDNQFQEDHHVR